MQRAILSPTTARYVWEKELKKGVKPGHYLFQLTKLPNPLTRLCAMPRQLRIQYPGAMYHVMSRGNRGDAIFLDNVDRHDWLKTLAES
jgi:hypothetical protein